MSTPSLPGWLQVVLIALTGVVGWMLLRPYRRITQLGGTDEKRTYLHLLLGSSRHTVKVEDKSAEDRKRRGEAGETRPRPESRNEQADAPSRPEDARNDETAPAPATSTTSSRRAPAEWTEPDVADEAPSYSIYRPGSGSGDAPAHTRPARRPESVRMSG